MIRGRIAMANHIGAGRSNYFKVADAKTFESWAAKINLNIWKGGDNNDLYAFSGDDEAGMVPTEKDVGSDEERLSEDFDFFTELAEHLAEGQVAIFMSAGAEKLRYIHGWAVAVNHKGEQINIDLSDIYDLVNMKWGAENFTTVEY